MGFVNCILSNIVQIYSPQLISNGKIAYKPVSGQILRGLAVERTPYRKTVYVWNVYLPFSRMQSRLNLFYSVKLTNLKESLYSQYFCGEVDVIVEQIISSINMQSSNIQNFLSDDSVQFLFDKWPVSKFCEIENYSVLFDLAFAAVVVGNFEFSKKAFIQCYERLGSFLKTELGTNNELLKKRFEEIKSFCDMAENDHKKLSHMVKQKILSNADDFGCEFTSDNRKAFQV